MVHTLSGIVLHRLYRMMRTGDAPAETRAVVEAMVGLVQELDPAFFERIGAGPARRDARSSRRACRASRRTATPRPRGSTRSLGSRVSLLVDHMGRARSRRPRDAVRAVLGATPETLSDDDALERAPRTRARTATGSRRCSSSVHSPARARDAPRELHVPEEALAHRRQPGPAPPHGAGLAAADDAHRHAAARRRHSPARSPRTRGARASTRRRWSAPGPPRTGCSSWACRSRRRSTCCRTPRRCASTRRGSLLYLAHKWVMRTCFNAQEEIYHASMDELEQVRAVHPRLARHMGPPCVLRYCAHHAHLHRGRALLRRAGLAVVPRRRPAPVRWRSDRFAGRLVMPLLLGAPGRRSRCGAAASRRLPRPRPRRAVRGRLRRGRTRLHRPDGRQPRERARRERPAARPGGNRREGARRRRWAGVAGPVQRAAPPARRAGRAALRRRHLQQLRAPDRPRDRSRHALRGHRREGIRRRRRTCRQGGVRRRLQHRLPRPRALHLRPRQPPGARRRPEVRAS